MRNQNLKPMFHIGSIVERELRKQGCSATWFAAKLRCNRQNVYNIFQRPSIDSDLLMHISLILHHNFFEELSDNYKRRHEEERKKLMQAWTTTQP